MLFSQNCRFALVKVFAVVICAVVLQGCSDAGAEGTTTAPSPAPPNLLSESILRVLEGEKDSLINPAIAAHMPDPLPVVVDLSTSQDAGCLPDQSGGCLCNMSSRYWISLKEIDGLKNLQITRFTTAELSESQTVCMAHGCDVHIVADVADDNLEINNGVAGVGLRGCLINTNATGGLTTHIDSQAVLSVHATAKPDLQHGCVQLTVNKADIIFNQISVFDTKADVNLAGFDVDVSKFADMISNAALELGREVANAVHTQISQAVTAAISKSPCIKFMGQDLEVV